MKFQLTILLLLISCMTFAHEDHYEAIELSNVHIKACDQYEYTIEIELVRSYADLINDFIRSIDSTERVFIQYTVDYCYFENYHYHFFYTSFFDSMIPEGFPFGYDYNLGFIKHDTGLVINFSTRHFKLKPILKLIEYGLNNKEGVIENHQEMRNRYKDPALDSIISERSIFREGKFNRFICTGLTDSIINSNITSYQVCEAMHNHVKFQYRFKSLEEIGVSISLFDDSVNFISVDSKIHKSVSSLHSFRVINDSTICIFNTNNSFTVINLNIPSTTGIHTLPFKVGCLDVFNITVTDDSNVLQIFASGEYYFDGEPTRKKAYYNLITDRLLEN